MKILHVIPAVAERYGGPSRAVLGMCRALQHRQVETHILTTNADGPGDELAVETGRLVRYEGVPTIFFPRRGEGFKYAPRLGRWARGNVGHFDAVHLHAVFSYSSVVVARACRVRDIPYVVRPLGSLDPWSLRQSAWKKRALLRLSAASMLRGAAAIHYTTAQEAELARPVAGGAPASIVPLGLEPGEIDTVPVAPGDREALVLAVSRLHPKKNLESLIEGFDLATRDATLSHWRLSIAGEGSADYLVRLREAARKSGAAERIDFVGWVGGDVKQTLLRRAALFAAPSYQENFGLGVLEALGRGTPAVVSDAVNLSGALKDAGAGWVVREGVTSLAQGLRAAMTDGPDRARRAQAALRMAQGLSWAVVAESLVEMYSAVTTKVSLERPTDGAAFAAERPH